MQSHHRIRVRPGDFQQPNGLQFNQKRHKPGPLSEAVSNNVSSVTKAVMGRSLRGPGAMNRPTLAIHNQY